MYLLDAFLYFLASFPGTARFSRRRPLIASLILAALIGTAFAAYRSYASKPDDGSTSIFGVFIIFGLFGVYSLAILIGLKNRLTQGPAPTIKN